MVFTLRADIIRVISLRKANARETAYVNDQRKSIQGEANGDA